MCSVAVAQWLTKLVAKCLEVLINFRGPKAEEIYQNRIIEGLFAIKCLNNHKFKKPRSGHLERAICICSHYIFALNIGCHCALIKKLFGVILPISV